MLFTLFNIYKFTNYYMLQFVPYYLIQYNVNSYIHLLLQFRRHLYTYRGYQNLVIYIRLSYNLIYGEIFFQEFFLVRSAN